MVQLLAQNTNIHHEKTPGTPGVPPKTPTITGVDMKPGGEPANGGLGLAGLGGGLGADLGTLKLGDRRLSTLTNYAQRRTSIMSTGKFQGIRE